MISSQSEAKAILDAVEHPENYCQLCHKKLGVCKHTKHVMICKRCHKKADYALMCGYCPDCFIEREDELKVILVDSLKHPSPGNSERLKAEIEEKALMNRVKNNMCLVHGYAYPCPVCDGEADS